MEKHEDEERFFLQRVTFLLATAIKCSKCCIHLFTLMMDVRKLSHLRGTVTFRTLLFAVVGWQMAFQ